MMREFQSSCLSPAAQLGMAYESEDITLAQVALNGLIVGIRAKDPQIGSFALYSQIASKVPHFVPERFQKHLMLEAQSPYPQRRKIAGEVFVFVNSKTILSAVSKFITSDVDRNDELVQIGITHALEKLPKLAKNPTLVVRLYEEVFRKVQKYEAQQSLAPLSIFKKPKFARVRTEVEAVFRDHPRGISKKKVEELVARLGNKYQVSRQALKLYIDLQNYVREPVAQIDEDDLLRDTMKSMLPDELLQVLDKIGLSERQKMVLLYHYGLDPHDPREHTLEETGVYVANLTIERIRQIIINAQRKFCSRPASKKFRDYL